MVLNVFLSRSNLLAIVLEIWRTSMVLNFACRCEYISSRIVYIWRRNGPVAVLEMCFDSHQYFSIAHQWLEYVDIKIHYPNDYLYMYLICDGWSLSFCAWYLFTDLSQVFLLICGCARLASIIRSPVCEKLTCLPVCSVLSCMRYAAVETTDMWERSCCLCANSLLLVPWYSYSAQ